MITHLFRRYEMFEKKEVGQTTERSHSRAPAKFGVAGVVLALIFILTFIIAPPAGQAAFPGTSGKMYWADATTDKVQRANLDGTGVEDLVTGSGAPVGIALDLASDKMYWTNNVAGTIQRANLDGTGVENLVTGVPNLTGIALDLAGSKIYFLGGVPDRTVRRANLDGTGVEELVGEPSGKNFIALDLAGGKMYWTDAGTDKIQRANLDGTGVEDLVTGLPGPSGIALDLASGKMYWAENALGKIQWANLDGTGVEDLVTGVLGPVGIALDLAGGKMYWTDAGTDKIQRANLNGTGVEDLVSGLSLPHGIALAADIPTALNVVPAPGEVYPGDMTTVDLNVLWAQDLYGLQAECAVDPAILDTQSGAFGPFFDTPLVGINSANAGAGTWFGGVSQQSPGAPLSGNGLYATITYQALIPGATNITCDPLASDIDGFELPVVMNDSSLTVLAFGSITGTVTYQGRLDHANIDVVATGPVTNSGTTDSAGDFEIDQLKNGSYDVEANALLYLPNCITTPVNSGQVTALAATALRGGDANNDEQISIGDATLIGANFGLDVPPGDANADINADARVNIQDLAILGGNFGLNGCQAW